MLLQRTQIVSRMSQRSARVLGDMGQGLVMCRERDLRKLLVAASPAGRFSVRLSDNRLRIHRPR